MSDPFDQDPEHLAEGPPGPDRQRILLAGLGATAALTLLIGIVAFIATSGGGDAEPAPTTETGATVPETSPPFTPAGDNSVSFKVEAG